MNDNWRRGPPGHTWTSLQRLSASRPWTLSPEGSFTSPTRSGRVGELGLASAGHS